uniref:Guanine nucleotide-binding protein G(q) subunit alpha n=2 Tax=Trichobilharzia regenti TaxID=157069 RepID=A0AA85IT10_TRIRE|nr:unnamed protein product [Trichobilharzia regenti]
MNLPCCAPFKLSPEQDSVKKAEEKARKISEEIDKQISRHKKMEVNCLKLLLLGTGESGKSTLLKQMKIIHINGFSNKEKLDHVPIIKQNIRDAILSILGGMKTLQLDFIQSRTADTAKSLMEKSLVEGYTYPESFFDEVDEIWRDPGVQRAFTRASEFQLFDSATYFMRRMDTIRRSDYIPTDQDILRCRKMTDSISELQFDIHTGRKSSVRFRIVDVSGQRGARKKWIQFFDNVTAILFLVDCSSFDQTLLEDNRQNRLIDSLEVFEQAWTNKYLRQVPMIVFLNKIDLLEEKICSGHRIDKLHTLAETWLQSTRCTRRKKSLRNLPEKLNIIRNNSSLFDADVGFDKRASSKRQSITSSRTKLPTHAQSASAGYTSSNRKFSQTLGDSSTAEHTQTNDTWSEQNQINKQYSSVNSLRSSFKLNHTSDYCTVLPILSTSSSSGQNSRVSCTTTIARLITDCPYKDFKPTAQQRAEFLTCLLPSTKPMKHFNHKNGNNKYGTNHHTGNHKNQEEEEHEDCRPYSQQPKFIVTHPETIRTACYIKFLFEELTKRSTAPYCQNRTCLFYYTCAVNTNMMHHILQGCQRFLIQDHLERYGLL